MEHYLYLAINFFSIIFPFILSFNKKVAFYTEWKYFFPANILVSLVFVVWDVYFTKIGVWGFNPRYLTGVYIFNLPIEECLFFVCIPYATSFSFACLKYYVKNKFEGIIKPISYFLIVFLLVMAVFNYTLLYTSVTAASCGIILFMLNLKRSDWLGQFYVCYLITLIPFFIVNGLLTGTGISEEVVWYNNQQNLNIRILTIPVEDFVYGMLLLLLNVALMEAFRKRLRISKFFD